MHAHIEKLALEVSLYPDIFLLPLPLVPKAGEGKTLPWPLRRKCLQYRHLMHLVDKPL